MNLFHEDLVHHGHNYCYGVCCMYVTYFCVTDLQCVLHVTDTVVTPPMDVSIICVCFVCLVRT